MSASSIFTDSQSKLEAENYTVQRLGFFIYTLGSIHKGTTWLRDPVIAFKSAISPVFALALTMAQYCILKPHSSDYHLALFPPTFIHTL